MKILLGPQERNNEKIVYEFKGEVVRVTIGEVTEEYDFTGVPDGELELFDPNTGEEYLTGKLPVRPITTAKKIDGVLYLELLHWVDANASYEERFPEWIDAEDYVPPKEEEEIGHEQAMEERGTNTEGTEGTGTTTGTQGDAEESTNATNE